MIASLSLLSCSPSMHFMARIILYHIISSHIHTRRQRQLPHPHLPRTRNRTYPDLNPTSTPMQHSKCTLLSQSLTDCRLSFGLLPFNYHPFIPRWTFHMQSFFLYFYPPCSETVFIPHTSANPTFLCWTLTPNLNETGKS